jgi:hypothetical protein
MSRFGTALTIIAVCVVVVHGTLFAAEWYVSYEKGLDALRGQRWEEAVDLLSDAISEKPEPKANAKTYGLRFIDYFPYVYRGVAYYHLGNTAKAYQDLERENSFGEVFNGSKDRDAQRLLQEHLTALKTRSQADNKFAEVKKLFEQKDYKKVLEAAQSVSKDSPRYSDIQKYASLAENELKKNEPTENVKKPEVPTNLKARRELVASGLNTGIQFFKRKEYDKAEQQFTGVLQVDENNVRAKEYLDKIRTIRAKMAAVSKPEPRTTTMEASVAPEKSAEQKELDALFAEGVDLFNKGKLDKAKSKLLSVRQRDASYPGTESYLEKVSHIQEATRNGVTAFFEGQYQQSIDQLGEASKSNIDNAHVYAFLACAYAAEYFLTGAENKDLQQNALNAYNRLKQLNAAYRFDNKYVSPKIIALLTGR